MSAPATTAGRGGLPRLTLARADGAACEVYLHGAHVTSYTTADGDEVLYVSERSTFAAGTAIRGGMPVVFPQFAGQGPLPKHGFARTADWAVVDGDAGAAEPWAALRLRDSDATRAIWPHAFEATLTVRLLADALRVELGMRNTGTDDAAFTAALHSYLRVGDAVRSRVDGLCGTRYSDKVTGERDVADGDDAVTFAREVDRVYAATPRSLVLRDAAEGRTLAITQEGFPDTVLWNPGERGAAGLADLTPGGETEFVCVEAAAAASPVQLPAGAVWVGAQTIATGRA